MKILNVYDQDGKSQTTGPEDFILREAAYEEGRGRRVEVFDFEDCTQRGAIGFWYPTFYTLRFSVDGEPQEKRGPASFVEKFGRLVMRQADRGRVTDIAVVDDDGVDRTFDFACFCV